MIKFIFVMAITNCFLVKAFLFSWTRVELDDRAVVHVQCPVLAGEWRDGEGWCKAE